MHIQNLFIVRGEHSQSVITVTGKTTGTVINCK